MAGSDHTRDCDYLGSRVNSADNQGVLTASMKHGKFYAYREKRTPGSPFLKVKFLEKAEGKAKIKIRYEDGPYPGLEDYVRPQSIIAPWGKRRSVERDEQRIQRLTEHHVRSQADRALAWAVSAVLCSTGEPSAWCEPDGVMMPEAEIDRIVARAGLDERAAVELHPLAFCDREGNVHLPIEAAEALARAFAAAEPDTVLMSIEDDVEQLRARGYEPGERFSHDYLREKSPGYALARQWAGHDQELEQLRKEIARLRSLVSMAEHDLRRAGDDLKAAKLRRALDGLSPLPAQSARSASSRPLFGVRLGVAVSGLKLKRLG